MATTKKITELNAAKSVAPTDKLALAQSAGGEAVAATVSQVAAAVAALNEEGALSELALATSAGKNLLAQRLTEKGVPTAANETLAQMADKVGGLVVDDGVEILKGDVVYDTGYLSVPSPYTPYTFKRLSNGDTLFLANNTLYYIPDGNYNDFNQFINAAVSSAACEIIQSQLKSSFVLSVCRDEQFAAVATGWDKVNFYEINTTAKTITLKKTFTLECPLQSGGSISVHEYGQGLSILPGGAFFTYIQHKYDNTHYTYVVAVNTQTEETSVKDISSLSYNSNYCTGFLNDTSEINGQFIIRTTGSYSYAYRVEYSIQNGIWTWGNSVKVSYCNLTVAPWGGFVYTKYESSGTVQDDTLRLAVAAYNADGTRQCITYLPYVLNRNIGYSSSYYYGVFSNIAPRIWKKDEKWLIEILPFCPLFVYDPTANTIVCQEPEYFPVSAHLAQGSNGITYLFGNKNTNKYWAFFDENVGIYSKATSGYLYWFSVSAERKITGVRFRAPSGENKLYWRPNITKKDLQSGAMDIRTANLPLPGAEEEEA